MTSKDGGYDVVLRGQGLDADMIRPGRWVFFQRLKEHGGGFWGGRTWPDFYEFGLPYPVSLSDGIAYMFHVMRVESGFLDFDEEFKLE